MFEFKKLKAEDMPLVLSWRLKPFVSKFLFTEVENDLKKQMAWFEKISKDSSYLYWTIHFDQRPIGLFNLSGLDIGNSKTNAGYYIGEESFSHLGGIIPPYFYNYIFKHLGLNKIYGEVVEGNTIIKMHHLHGYRTIGTFKEHIKKNNVFHNVHVVELMSSDWFKLVRYNRYVCPFEE